MKKVAIIMSTLFFILCFCACGSKNVYYDGKYDSDKYTQTSAISGTSIIIPNSIYEAKEPKANIDNYEQNDLPKHVFEASTDTDYVLYEPGLFILYIFDLGQTNGMDKKQDVADLPALIGTSKWLAFEDRNPDTFSLINKDGNTQAVYSAYITETMTGYKVMYSGYVTTLHSKDNNKDYLMFVGFADDKYDVAAKTIAENFLLAK